MRKYLFIVVLILITKISFACSIVCVTPTEVDDSVCFLEGKVIGHKTKTIGEDPYKKEIAYVVVEVTKEYYAPYSHSKVKLIPSYLGSSCEIVYLSLDEARKQYLINSVLTFIVKKATERKSDNSFYLSVCEYEYFYNGTLDGLYTYDYERRRKKRTELINARKDLQNSRSTIGFKEYNSREKKLDRRERVFYNKKDDAFVPEGIQFYIDLLELKRTRSNSRKMKILNSLLWSVYVRNTDFIDKQKIISEEDKVILRTQFTSIENAHPFW